MRLFDLLALGADRERGGFQVLVGASLVPAGSGCSVFWVRHGSVMLLKLFFQYIFQYGKRACLAPQIFPAAAVRSIAVCAADRTQSLAVRAVERHHGKSEEKLFLYEVQGLDFVALVKFHIKFIWK